MSYDRKLDQICPHRVTEEALFLDAASQVARPLRPISAVSSVEFRLNGAFSVPSAGAYAPAQVLGSREGPFTITPGVNDLFQIKVGNDALQTSVLPGGVKIPPERLVQQLSTRFRGVQFSLDGRRVGIVSEAKGREATFFVPQTATLAATLGLVAPRLWRGRTLAPGWTLINDPNTLLDRPTKLIVFDEPLKGFADYIEVNYVTLQQECRRCGGLGIESDWRYGATGEVAQVVDEALLIQEIQKLMYTVKGSNSFHLWYGTSIIESVGKKLTAGAVLQNTLVSDIYAAFNRWQSIKRQQEENVGQPVSDREFPYRLLAVNLQQSDQDPSVLFISITIQNRSSEPISIERGIRLPQPLDLLGSTQAQGIYRESLSKYTLSG